MTTLTIDDETANALREQAKARGISLEEHIHSLAQMLEPVSRPKRDFTPEEFEQWLRDLTSGPAVPSLPRDFSRADLYPDEQQ